MNNLLPFTMEHSGRNVTTIRMSPRSGWEQWFLLRSDAHHDNPHCDQAMERKHLELAKERGAGVIDNGDMFCAMQGKWDKRSCKDDLRPEHQKSDYLDALVRTAADFYQPFAESFVVINRGNHETAIEKRHETKLTERLVERLNERCKTNIFAGGYGGWVRFMFTAYGGVRSSKLMWMYHGTGGGGPVTRGTIQTNRMAVFNPDADFVLSGHTHDEWIFPITRQRLSDGGVPYHDEQLHLRAPGYKDAWGDGSAGFEVERMHGPKPKGALWLRFFWEGGQVKSEVMRAK